ncbi:MAG: carbon storage regulator [Lachnospiraceae bacterium]|nr:carbon storage regulator [Lachnospiraceae bacterium]
MHKTLMFRMVLINGEQLMLGEDIVIKSMTDVRVNLAIDAPRIVKIDRLDSAGKNSAE